MATYAGPAKAWVEGSTSQLLLPFMAGWARPSVLPRRLVTDIHGTLCSLWSAGHLEMGVFICSGRAACGKEGSEVTGTHFSRSPLVLFKVVAPRPGP